MLPERMYALYMVYVAAIRNQIHMNLMRCDPVMAVFFVKIVG